ncbi:MAG TPA: vitamin K epoxide reductase family protein [bacterium]|nr:vitamin K epoxide reductase family protein [bacterium]
MSIKKILLLAIALLALIGMGNAAYVTYLTFVKLPSTTAPLICDINSAWNCSQALQLTEAYILGVPSCTIAFFVYPVIIAIALLGYFGRMNRYFPILALLGIGGMALNGYVLAVDASFGVYCLLCVLCGIIITLIFASALTGWSLDRKQP